MFTNVKEHDRCPKCKRGTILKGTLGIYCPVCGWFPNWRTHTVNTLFSKGTNLLAD